MQPYTCHAMVVEHFQGASHVTNITSACALWGMHFYAGSSPGFWPQCQGYFCFLAKIIKCKMHKQSQQHPFQGIVYTEQICYASLWASKVHLPYGMDMHLAFESQNIEHYSSNFKPAATCIWNVIVNSKHLNVCLPSSTRKLGSWLPKCCPCKTMPT